MKSLKMVSRLARWISADRMAHYPITNNGHLLIL